MELNDLINTWNKTGVPTEVESMHNVASRHQRMALTYRSKLAGVTIPEMVGSIFCLAAAVYIGVNLPKLATRFLQATGVVTILLLLLLPLFSALSTRQLDKTPGLDKPYAETIKTFARARLRFVRLQKLNVLLCYLLLVGVIVLLSGFFGGDALSGNKYFWLFSFTLGYIFLLFYSRWVEKHYRNTLQEAEELLRELAG